MKNSSLYKLIQSLTKAEKKHFAWFASRQTGQQNNAYLLLYKTLEELKVYDEDKVKAAVKNRISPAVYRAQKYYLSTLLLKSLQFFHSGETIKSKIDILIDQHLLLRSKGLHQEAYEIIERAEQLADETESFFILTEIIDRKISFMSSSNSVTTEKEKLNQLFLKKKWAIERLAETTSCKEVYSRVIMHIKTRQNVSLKETKKFIKQILSEKIIRDSAHATTFLSKMWRLNTLALIYDLSDDFETSLYWFKEQKKLFDQHEKFKSIYSDMYFIVLDSIFLSCMTAKNLKEAFEMIKLLNEHFKILSLVNRRHFHFQFRLVLLELKYYAALPSNEKAIQYLANREEFILSTYSLVSIDQRSQLAWYVLKIYFSGTKFQKVFFWASKIINEEATEFTIHDHLYAHLVRILVCFEEKNFKLQASLVRSVKRKYRDSKILSPFEYALLRFFNKYRSNNSLKTGQAFVELKSELKCQTTSLTNEFAARYFDFLSWVERRL